MTSLRMLSDDASDSIFRATIAATDDVVVEAMLAAPPVSRAWTACASMAAWLAGGRGDAQIRPQEVIMSFPEVPVPPA